MPRIGVSMSSYRTLVEIPAVPENPFGPYHEEDETREREDAADYREAARIIRLHASRGSYFDEALSSGAVARLCDNAAAALERLAANPIEDIDAEFWIDGHPRWPDGFKLPNREDAEAFLALLAHPGAHITQKTVLRHAPEVRS